ncbi:ATP-binding protein [Saccharopolyspora pogona]|uniref:ATP-binding protein n=1 Tax=Saccharopolyspora pogona TaxID=333966 RepID=UPI0016890E07|nr:NB-ARC domain-containing protein [Saccharopolyspora pogona]
MAVIERAGRPGNLPVALTSFIGRRMEIAVARSLLSKCRVLTLTGTGGVGKTRLGMEVAAAAQRAFPDGVWLVELADLTDPTRLAQTVAGAVGLRDEFVTPALQLAEHLADKRTLIVLDDCEHVPDACALLLGKLLPVAPGVIVLATSRQRLGVEGEQIMHVDPFPVSSSGNSDCYEALQLFVERAKATAPAFELTDSNRKIVVAICQRLDGVPLAIELAAVWVAKLTPAQILSRLANRFGLLTDGHRGLRPHQRTLQATIDWSYSLCSPQEQALWSRLSLFTGGFDLEAVESVCSSDDVPRDEMLGLMAGLLDKSVVIRLDNTYGKARYRMLETVQSYGLARLAASGGKRRSASATATISGSCPCATRLSASGPVRSSGCCTCAASTPTSGPPSNSASAAVRAALPWRSPDPRTIGSPPAT